MNIETQIEKQITLDSYNKCWKSKISPPFAEFMEVLNDKLIGLLENQDPIEELNVRINKQVYNRINVEGKYLFSGQNWEIFGEVVWIPKNKFFRCKLYHHELEHTVEENPEHELLFDELEELIESNKDEAYKKCFQNIEAIAKEGNRDAIEIIAEQYADNDIIQNHEKSYFWYHLYYALDDEADPYKTKFENMEPDPDYPNHYGGKTGDFRNESMVSDLIEKLGLKKIKIIDAEVEKFLLNFK